MYIYIYIYILRDHRALCRQSGVPKSNVQLANRAIHLCHNRDPINQGHVLFFVCHFELTPFSYDQR